MRSLIYCLLVLIVMSACSDADKLEQKFANPPEAYKPMPFWHINGELTTEGIRQQMTDAKVLGGFSGVTVLPLSARSETRPGTTPDFLSDEFFERYFDILETARELDMQVILYDDIDFPSGMAGGKMQEYFPDYTRKRLDKIESEISGPKMYRGIIPEGVLMSAVAMNTETLDRVVITDYLEDNSLSWQVPEGNWKVMLFVMVKDSSHKKYLGVDYLDTAAVRNYMSLTYDVYAERLGDYFGNIIQTVFFDDVGFFQYERAWTGAFNTKFKELNGFDPEPYYPALWHDIGPETEAARHAFFKTRAELLADGYMKLVGEWSRKHGLRDTGHPPGSYRKSPIDMNGDILKYYRHTAIPLTDDIIDYGVGRDGFKLVSSAADYYDRPVVGMEIYGAYKENIFDSLMLYRPLMEAFVRGINFIIPHGLWYNSEQVYISPLVSPYSDKIAAALPAYSEYVGRSCLLLQGGRRVADIGLIYPFESLAGYFYFEAPKPRFGEFASPETDYLVVSDWLTNDIRRDFTFIHPEFFIGEKYELGDGSVTKNNPENTQEFKILILSGSNIITIQTLEKIRDFYAKGGKVVSTTQLPYKSAELGQDQKVIDLVKEIFGVDPLTNMEYIQHNTNANGGEAFFLPRPDKRSLQQVLAQLQPAADVIFPGNTSLSPDYGKFSYIHKINDGKHIYLFANSSDDYIDTDILLKGKLKPQLWNPHTGEIIKNVHHEEITLHGERYTKLRLSLEPVKSIFIVSGK